MDNILALDVGMRRTGVAFSSAETGVPVVLDTIKHTSDEDLFSQIIPIASSRHISTIVVGNPLLPSGEEGLQSSFVHSIASKLKHAGFRVDLLDERYSSQGTEAQDLDASAACTLLLTYLERMT